MQASGRSREVELISYRNEVFKMANLHR